MSVDGKVLRRLAAVGVLALLPALLGGAAVAAVAAHREIHVLCGMMQPGRSLDALVRMLESMDWSAWSTWSREASPTGRTVHMSSRWNLGIMRCEVAIARDAVVSARLID